MRIEQLTSDEWKKVLNNFSSHTFFSRSEWFELFERQYPNLISKAFVHIYDDEQEIWMPLLIQKNKSGCSTISSSPSGGPISIFSSVPLDSGKIKEIIHFLQQKFKAVQVEITLDPYSIDTNEPNSRTIARYTHLLKLENTYDSFEQQFEYKARKNIAMANRSGLITSIGEKSDVDVFYSLMKKIMVERFHRSTDSILPLELYRQLLDIEGTEIIVVKEKDAGKIVSATIAFFTQLEYFQWHNATDYEFAKYRPNDCWESFIIRRAIDKKCGYLNFGASPTEGVERFKESFGAKKIPYYCYSITSPWFTFKKRIRQLLQNR